MHDEPFSNRLIKEKSPYLLQHAHNPVDWYPWGTEAFDQAKATDRPIFLSIGYATCHWCHVMERECFENPEIARRMNDAFVNIKVDREEHPEVDKLYMEFAQALMSTGGGWPLNVILTPDLKPFFAATYLPPHTNHGLTGLSEVINHIEKLWKSDQREVLFEQANRIVEVFEESVHLQGEKVPDDIDLLNAFELLFELADPVHGGLKGAPKFPMGYLNSLFLTYAKLRNDSRALYFVELTLDKMGAGGIYDHLGGGFSRYTIDESWKIPHFEKMLYDNAILSLAYTEAWQFTKKPSYERIVREVLAYVLREMRDANGSFFSAQDADSEGKEGKFYTWTRKEIDEILPPEVSSIFCEYYHVTLDGNFEGRNVLFYDESIENFASKHSMSPEEAERILAECRKTLFSSREKREKPFKDDKALTSWNALMSHAFLEAGLAFNEPSYLKIASDAILFIQQHLWKDGRLLRRYREGDTKYAGGLGEYAYLISTLIRMFEAGMGTNYLHFAFELNRKLEMDFKDEEGAFFSTEESDEILVRRCDFFDGAEPSGNAVHAENLLKLYQITLNPLYLLHAEEILKAGKNLMDSYPPGVTYYLKSLYRYIDQKLKTIIIALDESENGKEEIGTMFFSHYLPHTTIIWKRSDDQILLDLLPQIADKKPIEGKTTMYICTLDACLEPITSIDEMKKEISKL